MPHSLVIAKTPRARAIGAAIVRLLGASAVVVAGYLLYLAYKFNAMDPIIGIPFVFGCVIGALIVGLPGLYMLVTGRVSGMPNPLGFF